MQPDFLLPEIESREDGSGPVVEANTTDCLVTLGITQALEKAGLEVSIWGSEDGEHWGAKPLAEFPAKSYCGRYSMKLDLQEHPGVKQLRAAWRMRKWTHDERNPMFAFYIQCTDVTGQRARAVAGA
jgi:hypothetical protein